MRIPLLLGWLGLSTLMAIGQPNEALRQEIEGLKQQIVQLQERLQQLEARLAQQEAAPAAVAPATNLPQISLIANGSALFQDRRLDPKRNRFEQDEIELAFQSYVYPSIRFDAIMAMGKENDFALEVEEAYASIIQLGNTPFGAKLGRMRLPFGRVSPIHPHFRLFQDNPLPIANLVGEEGAISNGGLLSYLLPSSRAYLNLQMGLLTLNEEGALGGSSDLVRIARLLVAPRLHPDHELELAFSGLTTQAEVLDEEGNLLRSDPVRLLGVDFQYRRFFGPAQRLLFAGEWFQSRRESEGTPHTRDGFYLLASYRANRYWEYGLRYDQSRRAFLGDPASDGLGPDRALSAILTYRLNEQSFLRLQWRHLRLADERARHELLFQMMVGFGPHSHPLESSQ